MKSALTFASAAAAVAGLLVAPTASGEPAPGAPPAPNGLYSIHMWKTSDPASEELPPIQRQIQAGAPGTFKVINPQYHLVYEWKNNAATGDQVWYAEKPGGLNDLECKVGHAMNPPQQLVLRPEGNKLVGYASFKWSQEFPGCPDPATGQVSTDYTPSSQHLEYVPV